MILDGAQSVLGYFGFERTAYGDTKNTVTQQTDEISAFYIHEGVEVS